MGRVGRNIARFGQKQSITFSNGRLGQKLASLGRVGRHLARFVENSRTHFPLVESVETVSAGRVG